MTPSVPVTVAGQACLQPSYWQEPSKRVSEGPMTGAQKVHLGSGQLGVVA